MDPTLEFIFVVWVDAGGKQGWVDTDDAIAWADALEEFTIFTVGVVIAEDDDALVMSSSVCGGKVLDPIRIPTSAIITKGPIKFGDDYDETYFDD